MAIICVTHLHRDRFLASTRGHPVLVDQPGEDIAPSPVELCVVALATCAAHYAVGYLRERGEPECGVTVECRWSMRPDPPRVGRVRLAVRTPQPLSDEHRAGLLTAVDRCTVHNTLRMPPDIEVQVTDGAAPVGQR
ncbi:OsmC family protein [Actinokineospora guangxiensis]|uniref:OsmC family protein n=1 Tax=Actinokineospora guangxiensis TaxID=1490288 RepID=A0ABW0EZD5_9PSEU